jgi:predicted nucleic acid-binding Zn ribbon protein
MSTETRVRLHELDAILGELEQANLRELVTVPPQLQALLRDFGIAARNRPIHELIEDVFTAQEAFLPTGEPDKEPPQRPRKTCVVCAMVFETTRSTQVACSSRCRQIRKLDAERQKVQAHRRNYKEQICRRCHRPFLPSTGSQSYCFMCQELRKPVPVSIPKTCVVCGAVYTPKVRRQRTCGGKPCRQAIHNVVERNHWERRGAARQAGWYWERGGKEAKRQARLTKQAVA